MREIISLNENWTLSFPKGERPTEQVTLPHTWNAVDGMDGNGSYLRTTGVYTRTFTQPKQPLAERTARQAVQAMMVVEPVRAEVLPVTMQQAVERTRVLQQEFQEAL